MESLIRDSEAKEVKGLADIGANQKSGNEPKKTTGMSNPSTQSNSFASKIEMVPKTQILKGDEVFSSILISYSGKYLIAGTEGEKGLIRVFSLPDLSQICEININSTGIKKLVLTHDDSMIFAIGKDNSIFFVDLKDKELKDRKEKDAYVAYLEEFLVDEKKLKRQIEEIDTLQTKLFESEKLAELNMKKTRLMKEEYVKSFEAKMRQVVEDRQTKVKQIETDIQQLVEEHQQYMDDVNQKHTAKKTALEAHYNQRMERENQKHGQTKEAFHRVVDEQTAANEKIKEEYTLRTQQLNEKFTLEIAEIDREIELVEGQIKDSTQNFGRIFGNVETNLDGSINDKKVSHEQELEKLVRDKNKREYELNLAKLEFNNMIHQKNLAEKDNKDFSELIKTEAGRIKNLRNEKETNDREIEEREKTIVQKQERISELINKKHELDKFKFVLHYKIEELKKEKGPREIEIAKMKQQLEAMQQEIYLFAKNNSQLKLSVSEYNLKLQGQTKMLKEINRLITEKNNNLANFKHELSNLIINSMDDFKELKKGLVAINNAYVEEYKNQTITNEKKKTFTEQRSHLENCLKTLKDKFGRSISLHKNDHKRVMKENVDLISAINELKREKKLKMDNISKVEMMKQDAQKEIDLAVRINKNSEVIRELKSRIDGMKKMDSIKKIN
jgi:hypothetical protein